MSLAQLRPEPTSIRPKLKSRSCLEPGGEPKSSPGGGWGSFGQPVSQGFDGTKHATDQKTCHEQICRWSLQGFGSWLQPTVVPTPYKGVKLVRATSSFVESQSYSYLQPAKSSFRRAEFEKVDSVCRIAARASANWPDGHTHAQLEEHWLPRLGLLSPQWLFGVAM